MPKPESGQALVRVFGSSVNPVNVDLVEPICKGFGCSAGTFGTDMAGVVVVGEDCDLMYGSESGASCRVRTPSMPWRPAV